MTKKEGLVMTRQKNGLVVTNQTIRLVMTSNKKIVMRERR
jgi:hypothetical protein